MNNKSHSQITNRVYKYEKIPLLKSFINVWYLFGRMATNLDLPLKQDFRSDPFLRRLTIIGRINEIPQLAQNFPP